MSTEWLQLLRELSSIGKDLADHDSLDEYKRQARQLCSTLQLQLQQLSSARKSLESIGGSEWQAYNEQGISVPDAIRILNACVKHGSGTQPHIAAALLSWLLCANGAPVHHILDALVLSALLQRIKDTVQPPTSTKAADKDAEAAADADDEPNTPKAAGSSASAAADDLQRVLALEALRNMGTALQQVSLRSHQDALQMCVDVAVDLLPATKAVKVPAALKGEGVEPGTFSSAAVELLKALVHGRHGSCADIAALVLPKLTPLLLGTVTGPGKRSASELQAIKASALDLVKTLLRSHPEIQAAVAALARHVCLKAPDKADTRAAAVKAATDMAAELPSWEQDQLAGFAYVMSRSSKPSHRALAVGLASSLLMHLPEPFKFSTFLQPAAAADGAAHPEAGAPAGYTRAPWSVVCLAAMLHRCSDRSAVVRARGLSDLADVVDCFGELLASDPASEQYGVAEAFVLGLAAAAHVQVPRAAEQPAAARQQRNHRASAAGQDADDAQQQNMEEAAADEEMADAAGAAGDQEQQGQAAAAADEQQQPEQQVQAGYLEAWMPCKNSSDLGPLMALVHRRCADPKAAVRKGALQLLEHLVVMRASWQGYPRELPAAEDLVLLEAATADPLVTVRKAALVALSRLLEIFPTEPLLCGAWVRAALPLVRDTESSVQESLMDWAAALLIDKAAEARRAGDGGRSGGGRRGGGDDKMDVKSIADSEMDEGNQAEEVAAAVMDLQPLLAAVAATGRSAAACLGRLCGLLAAKKKLKGAQVAAGLLVVIQGSGMGSSEALGGWVVLKEVTAQDPKAPSWQLLQQRWRALQAAAAAYAGSGVTLAAAEGGAGEEAAGEAGAAPDQGNKLSAVAQEGAALLLVISNAAESFPDSQAAELADELLKHLLSFQLQPATAAAHVAALHRLSLARTCSKAVGKPADWSRQLYSAAHDVLHRYISSSGAQQQQLEPCAVCAVFSCGEVALLRACPVPGRLSVLLQALTAEHLLPPSCGGGGSSSQPGAGSQPADMEVEDAGGSQATEAGGASGGAGGRVAVPMGLQAHTWVAFGKLCLVDEPLAKKCVPLFVQALSSSPHPVVRNNIMVALSDMAIQFTALVDSHMPRLAACIRDSHELVRRQALALLANLLMKDYVKWRGALFHRFLLALVDPSPAVQQLAEFLLSDTLATKAPLLAYNHFLESLFVLNGCNAGLQAARQGGAAGGGAAAGELPVVMADEQGQYTLTGAGNRAQRDVIYTALLEHMAPEHKFNTAAKLCSCVLVGVVDGLLPLEECSEVLRDALAVLASKEIKVTASRFAAADEDEPAAGGSSQAGGAAGAAGGAGTGAMLRARGKVISALMKRHLVEAVVPVLVELRRLLMEEKHPLLQEVMSCFASLLKEYKGEVEEMFVADKLLAKEIMFDIRQAEQKQRQAAAAATAAAAAAPAPTPAAAAAAAGTQQQRQQVPASSQRLPPGVLPGTPIAAEVLRTAECQRQQQQQMAGTGGAGGAQAPDAAPAPRGAPAAAAGGYKTPGPATNTPRPAQQGGGFGSVQSVRSMPRHTPGGRGGATPAPLSVKRTPRQQQQQDENKAPDSGSNGLQLSIQKLLQPGPARAGISAATVMLPSPFKEPSPQRWNIPQQVVEGSSRGRRAGKAVGMVKPVEQEQAAEEKAAGGSRATRAAGRGSKAAKPSSSSQGLSDTQDTAAAAGSRQRAGRASSRSTQPQESAEDPAAAKAAGAAAVAAGGQQRARRAATRGKGV